MLEPKLQTLEGLVDEALRSGTTLAAKLRKLKKAVKVGDLRDIDKGLAETRELAAQVQLQAGALNIAVDEDYFPDRFLQELQEAAASAGLRITVLDGKIYCYPLLVRVRGAERSVQIGAKQERGVRPSVLISELRNLQARPGRFESQGFLNLLHKAYTYCLSGKESQVVSLGRIYEILTLMPGASRDYTRDDFSRDLYLLDRSPGAATRSGYVPVLSASTGTRHGGDVFLTVGEDGAEKRYYGIKFHKQDPDS
ncbi:MAG: hypothetical protein SGI92_24450 [Bryobacteraceae bacterium]|nr:hypothetical protein [Bryobacteraceae bacterium]